LLGIVFVPPILLLLLIVSGITGVLLHSEGEELFLVPAYPVLVLPPVLFVAACLLTRDSLRYARDPLRRHRLFLTVPLILLFFAIPIALATKLVVADVHSGLQAIREASGRLP
jgi:hypothetical protein